MSTANSLATKTGYSTNHCVSVVSQIDEQRSIPADILTLYKNIQPQLGLLTDKM